MNQDQQLLKNEMNTDSLFKLATVEAFGRPQSFIESFGQDHLKHLNFVMAQFLAKALALKPGKDQHLASIKKIQRKKSDPKFDDAAYLDLIEQQLLLSIPNKPEKQQANQTKIRVRKYSDDQFDKPEYNAKIQQQTLNMIQSLTGETFDIEQSQKKSQHPNSSE